MKGFPKTIHVTRQQEGTDDEFLSVEREDFESIDEDTIVAVYTLVEVGEVAVTRQFVPKPARRSTRRRR